jgi:hypothetical protein
MFRKSRGRDGIESPIDRDRSVAQAQSLGASAQPQLNAFMVAKPLFHSVS